MSHESRGLYTAAGHGRHFREGHSQRSHARIFTVGNHHSVAERLDTADTLEASAGGHGILHDGIQGYVLQGTLGEFLHRFIHVFVGAQIFINGTFLGYYLAGA